MFKNAAIDAPEETAKKHQIDSGKTILLSTLNLSGRPIANTWVTRIAALRFQPTKRPQLAQKPKAKTFPKAPPAPDLSSPSQAPSTAGPPAAKASVKSTLADWTAAGDDDDVNGFYAGEKRQRGGRKRRKKNRDEYVAAQDWDDIYDPSRPNSYEEYKHSEEQIREVREWKDRLYAHRRARKPASDADSSEDDYRPQMSSKFMVACYMYYVNGFADQFAPPSNYSFAPPPMDSPPKAARPADTDSDAYSPTPTLDQQAPPPPPESLPPPAPPSEPVPAGTISRAPVRYNLPPPPSDIPGSEAELEKALAAEPEDADQPDEDAPRSSRPGQKGFAERLMSKYGWSRGTGLGADGSGIINPLRVQVEKRKKKSDAEGGGFRDTGGRGKIIGGKKNIPEKEEEVGKFGPMSEVIVLRGMVDGMNLDEEVEGAGDGGLMQEIGDECAEKVCMVPDYTLHGMN